MFKPTELTALGKKTIGENDNLYIIVELQASVIILRAVSTAACIVIRRRSIDLKRDVVINHNFHNSCVLLLCFTVLCN